MANRLLIDTDVLIDYLRGVPQAISYLETQAESLVLSAVSVAELYAGVREGTEREALAAFVAAVEVVPVDQANAKRGGVLRRDYGKKPRHRTGRRTDRGYRRASQGHCSYTEPQALPYVG